MCKGVKTVPEIPPLPTNEDLFQGGTGMLEHSDIFWVTSCVSFIHILFDIKVCME